ncbi:hypothetical protein [Streptomyces chilikensis]|uniref:hypothetical protein n=1 Tax=Streptomyces chilikensis TaxID=1194079 RepID=UPI000B10A2F1|nr:hypothetical protein [Streptomyces chilikensis]
MVRPDKVSFVEIGSLVEQYEDLAIGRTGTVREHDGTAVVVEWEGGETEQLSLPLPERVRLLVPGSIRFRAATGLAALQEDFRENPVGVLVQMLREMGEPASITMLRRHAKELGLGEQVEDGRWGEVRELLLTHPHVSRSRSQGRLRWSDVGSSPHDLSHELSVSEALRQLANHTGEVDPAVRKSLRRIVTGSLYKLSPYELLAAHSLDFPVAEWPREWAEPHPEQIAEEVRALAVTHITEVARARRRVVLPGTHAGRPAKKDTDIPGALPLTPLLVPLVAMPAPSRAADRAAKAVIGEDAWSCMGALMDRFEQAMSSARGPEKAPHVMDQLAPLVVRAKELLRSTLLRRPKDDDAGWFELVDELVTRACFLRAHPRLRDLPKGPVHEWITLVADCSAVPQDIRASAAKAAQTMVASGRWESLAAAAGPAVPAEVEVSPDALDASDGPETDETVPDAVEEAASTSVSPAGEETAAAAEAVEDDTLDTPDTPDAPETSDTVPSTPQPEWSAQAEVEALTRLLEEERKNAESARAELERQGRAAAVALSEAEAVADRLRLRVEEEKNRQEEAEERARAAEAKWESVQRALEEEAQRVERLTTQVRRRDDELRQARQTARGASQAQLRQARIDTLRVLAGVLAEVADQAAHEGGETGPATALYRRALARAAAAGVLDFGVPGEETEYDQVRHRAPGGPATRVVVERPGFVWQGPREPEPVVLEHALVRRVKQ